MSIFIPSTKEETKLYIPRIIGNFSTLYFFDGAEHKCINCIESGLPLTVENVKVSSRFHKRCGTSFLLIVMVISIIFFIFIQTACTDLIPTSIILSSGSFVVNLCNKSPGLLKKFTNLFDSYF